MYPGPERGEMAHHRQTAVNPNLDDLVLHKNGLRERLDFGHGDRGDRVAACDRRARDVQARRQCHPYNR